MVLCSGDPATIFNYKRLTHIYFWFILGVVGFLGFLTSLSSTWEIQVIFKIYLNNRSWKYFYFQLTSPLTHGISGSAKTSLQTSFTVLKKGELKSPLWWASNLTVAVGTIAFALIKRNRMKRKLYEQVSFVLKSSYVCWKVFFDSWNISK